MTLPTKLHPPVYICECGIPTRNSKVALGFKYSQEGWNNHWQTWLSVLCSSGQHPCIFVLVEFQGCTCFQVHLARMKQSLTTLFVFFAWLLNYRPKLTKDWNSGSWQSSPFLLPLFFYSIPPFKNPPRIWVGRIFCTNCYFHVMLVPTLNFNTLPSSSQCTNLIQVLGSRTSPLSRQLLIVQAKELILDKFCIL